MNNKYSVFEEKWLAEWERKALYEVQNHSSKPKFYCLDMFPYPSGSGLHVGHPRGYIASDIISRHKRMLGYHVLHPIGFDSFGLPAEQYAIETGLHPEATTCDNIANFRQQLRRLGCCFDPARELRTSDPGFYRWTQWIFLKLFDSWYDMDVGRARPIEELIMRLAVEGNAAISTPDEDTPTISAGDWNRFSQRQRSDFLMRYRLAYRGESMVNWCPALGTVLANDEVKDGLSERGGHPVERRKMQQWMLRITAYADRLLAELDGLQWPAAVKDIQRNWIGKSLGCEIRYPVIGAEAEIVVFSTRPETLYGNTFLVLAPEHPLVTAITAESRRAPVQAYVDKASLRSERERQAGVERVTGAFTGAFARHPLTQEALPVWISDYVLADYGTGAIMAVPSADERDYRFACKFRLDLRYVFGFAQDCDPPFKCTDGPLVNSRELDGLSAEAARLQVCERLEQSGCGRRKVRFRMRDAVFGRQRYWGEPIPIFYHEADIPHAVGEHDLPIVLPQIDEYLPTADGQPPIARAKDWRYCGHPLETTTMPGWAGSSWYFLRYMDPTNNHSLVGEEAVRHWQSVDLYIGGAEHATGHLLYARFWTHFLYDLGFINFCEPFSRLMCQGMILGQSAIIYRDKLSRRLVSADLKDSFDVQPLYVDINLVDRDNCVDLNGLRAWRKDFEQAEFVLSSEKLFCERVSEKMSKSKYNAVTPDSVIDHYGADCLRLYEMFLGPIDQVAVWTMHAIDGPQRFLDRVRRLYLDDDGNPLVTEETPCSDELQIIHRAIRDVGRLTECLSFNTAIAALMTCVNQLVRSNCRKRTVLDPLLRILHPYAPFLTQELWTVALGNNSMLLNEAFPNYDASLLHISTMEYPVSINGKVRGKVKLPVAVTEQEAKDVVLANSEIKKWVEHKTIVNFICVPGKIISLVV